MLIVYTKEEFDHLQIQLDNATSRVKYLERMLWSYQLADLPPKEQNALYAFDRKTLCGMGKLAAIKAVREGCDVSLLTAKNAVEGWIAGDLLLYLSRGIVHARNCGC